jgi:hypothetical protein
MASGMTRTNGMATISGMASGMTRTNGMATISGMASGMTRTNGITTRTHGPGIMGIISGHLGGTVTIWTGRISSLGNSLGIGNHIIILSGGGIR